MFRKFPQFFIKIHPPQAWMHTDKKHKSNKLQLLLSGPLIVMTLHIPQHNLISCGDYNLLLSCSSYLLRLAKTTAYTFWLFLSRSQSQVNCKVCLKSAGLHEFFGWFWLVLCCLKASHRIKKCLNFDGLSGQETNGQHFPFPINCSKIGHSYEAFTYLFGQNIFICLLSTNKNSPVDLLKLAREVWDKSEILLTVSYRFRKKMNSRNPRTSDLSQTCHDC